MMVAYQNRETGEHATLHLVDELQTALLMESALDPPASLAARVLLDRRRLDGWKIEVKSKRHFRRMLRIADRETGFTRGELD
jgi:hypothetical protein